MNCTLIAVDKLREPYVRDGCRLYLERLSPIMPVTVREIRRGVGAHAADDEAQRMLRHVGDAAVWALDERGTLVNSPAFARMLAALGRTGARDLTLAIGGATGLGAAVRRRADFIWSLSPLTFLHEMARLIVLEQLYRAVKINRGEPYHR
ncbi:MAG: 23S rRNA (pseudouridine(1915)-N(3))-methyltransferase RlmH [Candidatus Eremiobacter antarcticus]|nr:23S rRNA (pseudouridine(1915)-N(3))-methyltransferase RlmH [Candidatus Eremiobacteraeota bacterium]MBC5808399.1 23S rRNA (pseudouridine(1915)-N(3))-methyltransferase RlmH [Candidatus Eremiobacteraeota bacterium]